MKTQLLTCFLLLGAFAHAQTTNPNYNKPLADSLGADVNGMKLYTFVILKTGAANTTNKVLVDSAFAGHM